MSEPGLVPALKNWQSRRLSGIAKWNGKVSLFDFDQKRELFVQCHTVRFPWHRDIGSASIGMSPPYLPVAYLERILILIERFSRMNLPFSVIAMNSCSGTAATSGFRKASIQSVKLQPSQSSG